MPKIGARKAGRTVATKARTSCSLPSSPVGTDEELDEILKLLFGPSYRRTCDPETVQDAEGRLRFVANDLLENLISTNKSNSLAVEIKHLRIISRLSRILRREISNLDDITREFLERNLRYLAEPRRIGPIPPDAPKPRAAESIPLLLLSEMAGHHPLDILATAAERTEKYFEAQAQESKGGPGTLLTKIMGEPRLWLALEAARLLGAAQGTKAVVGTADGTLHRLTAGLWSYATGTDAETADLHRYVKAAAPAVRTRRDLIEQGDFSATRLHSARINELRAETQKIRKRLRLT